MFPLWFKLGFILILGLSVVEGIKTHKKIKKGEIQWIAWKGKSDSLYLGKQK